MTIWQKVQAKLDEMATTLGLRGLTLASEDGLMLASAGQVDGEWIAAMCPVLKGPSGSEFRGQLDAYKQRKGIAIEVLDVSLGSQSLFLCAAGQEGKIDVPKIKTLLQKIHGMLDRS